jgi:hypothetical protein
MKLHPGYEKRPDDPRFVDCVKTPLTEEEATYYLRKAWKNVLGSEPTIDSLALLWAKSLGETGRWKLLRNNNWGNIKKKPQWKYTSYEAGEILQGKHQMFYPYHPQTHFAAWDTPLEGAEAYIDFLANPKSRYHKAWAVVVNSGDPVKYTYELHKAGYFTAKLEVYTRGMVRLTSEFKRKADKLMAWEPEVVEPEPIPEPEPKPDSDPIIVKPDPVKEEPEPLVETEEEVEIDLRDLEEELTEEVVEEVKTQNASTWWAMLIAFLSRIFLFWKK